MARACRWSSARCSGTTAATGRSSTRTRSRPPACWSKATAGTTPASTTRCGSAGCRARAWTRSSATTRGSTSTPCSCAPACATASSPSAIRPWTSCASSAASSPPRRSTWSTTACPPLTITLEQKLASRELMLQYAENLYGFRPDYIFTHVTRMVPSKALWRDVRVLEHLEWNLAAQGKSAVLFIVSTAVAHRPPRRKTCSAGRPSTAGRSTTAATTATCCRTRGTSSSTCSNRSTGAGGRSKSAWSTSSAGNGRAAATGCRRRCASPICARARDLEFGQSIYEPFGIAQVEPLSAGALCVPSSVCGCVGFVSRANGRRHPRQP